MAKVVIDDQICESGIHAAHQVIYYSACAMFNLFVEKSSGPDFFDIEDTK